MVDLKDLIYGSVTVISRILTSAQILHAGSIKMEVSIKSKRKFIHPLEILLSLVFFLHIFYVKM